MIRLMFLLVSFQLTHSRGVRLVKSKRSYHWMAISTHALTWSATNVDSAINDFQSISTHALTWSAT